MAELVEPLCGIPADLLEPMSQAMKPPTDALQPGLDEQQWKGGPC
jgi:hypothetical protein